MNKPKLLLIDNYDSFTYNLVQAFLVMDVEVLVYRNDEITVREAVALNPTHLCISPGPGRPNDAGISLAMIAAFEGKTPVLGVCLGHQTMVQHFGGEIVSAGRLMHGKTSIIEHDAKGLFAGLSQPLEVGRYHSLAADRGNIPDCLEVTARSDGGEIMGVRHKALPMESVQFHPESVLTPEGDALLANFLKVNTDI
ncbi:MAG: aminodeoxychorismate/anthranilate synthase component II [Gammaproteobacteria bacterium]|jgi:anthranilate synthase/aminodeoxychorismate synthase-like glutamine amidotransferase|nr:aminodeoxychorismate/anthranilate synthase component II [Gammaproteobacteria bacterium]